MLQEIKEFRNYLYNTQFIRWGRVYTEKRKNSYRCKLYCVDWYHTDNINLWDKVDFERLLKLKFGKKFIKSEVKPSSNKYSKHKLKDVIFFIKTQ